MEGIGLGELALGVNGNIDNNSDKEIIISGISIDSRKTNEGEVFIAIKGLNMDGHDYVEAALNKGARAAIVSRRLEINITQILVEDTSTALKQLAGYYRDMFNIPIIGVTGSTGKTSTKEIIACVLSKQFNVHKTQKNYNNEIGLPLTLFELNKKHDLSVLEMGMSNLNEIRRLAEISKPTIAVITNIGSAHIESLKSRENILKAKMEITTFFNKESVLIVNTDDEYLANINSKDYIVKKISINKKGDYNAYDIINMGEEGVEFKCIYKKEVCNFKLMIPGIHNVYNALFAIALGELFGISAQLVKEGISEFRQVGDRMNIINLHDEIKILSDSYNANPDSMKAGIDILDSFSGKRKIAVLGDMYELGSFSEAAHRNIGKYLTGKCDVLVAVGKDAFFIYEEAKEILESYYFEDKNEAGVFIDSLIYEGDIILIKASRGMKMEDITSYLLEDRKKGI
jgi:UDP-N-acetylmuramoyl-tripeptide--D-alanyl-D-alanine ligase